MIEDKIKKLIKILEDSKVDELEVSTFWGKQRIKISKRSKSSYNRNVEIVESSQRYEAVDELNIQSIPNKRSELDKIVNIKDEIKPSDSNSIIIKAPLVGTYYKSSKPGEPPFINIGDKIEVGQIICIIEAMKIFNEIESEHAGIVTEIHINDGTPVEYDQVLINLSSE